MDNETESSKVQEKKVSGSTIFLSFGCLLVILLMFVYVWPTRYRYEHVQNNLLIRIDRFNGNVDVLQLHEGWRPVKSVASE